MLMISIFFRISVLGGCRGQVGGTRFQVVTGTDQRICGLMNKALHNTCIMHLGEHLQETYAIEVNRDVTDKI